MYRFYVEPAQITDMQVTITGTDVNHIKNVLRLKTGDKITICNGQGRDYYCIIDTISSSLVSAQAFEVKDTDTELSLRITLFQGLPKKDKMELIIQKAVELGVHEIVPVITKRTVVKIEDSKKEQKKLIRWQAIAASAAKQSCRGIIPEVRGIMGFEEALNYSKAFDHVMIPYEKAEDMAAAKAYIKEIKNTSLTGVFIGPEGGFDESEILLAKEFHVQPITLGRRILRTETAGLTMLSILMYESEQ